jgi:hypothetical protein
MVISHVRVSVQIVLGPATTAQSSQFLRKGVGPHTRTGSHEPFVVAGEVNNGAGMLPFTLSEEACLVVPAWLRPFEFGSFRLSQSWSKGARKFEMAIANVSTPFDTATFTSQENPTVHGTAGPHPATARAAMSSDPIRCRLSRTSILLASSAPSVRTGFSGLGIRAAPPCSSPSARARSPGTPPYSAVAPSTLFHARPGVPDAPSRARLKRPGSLS